jgi:hypothetical protein
MNRKYIIALLIVIFLIIVIIAIYNQFSNEMTKERVETSEVVNHDDSHIITPYSETNNSVTASNYINYDSISSDSDSHKEQLYIFRELPTLTPTTLTPTPTKLNPTTTTTFSSKTSTTPSK